jgi:hypothetical protein
VTSITYEVPGKKAQVNHTVEVKKTDKAGRVTTTVRQHGDELGWHAGKSKWNAKPLELPPPPEATVAVNASGLGATGHAQPPPLPAYYYTQTEALKGYAVTGKPPMRLTQEFLASSMKMYGRNSATNFTYGAWYMS